MTEAAQATRFVFTSVIFLTAEQVKALQVGETVQLCGEALCVTCTVASRGGAKFLTYRVKGKLRYCFIEDYPGATYSKGGE